MRTAGRKSAGEHRRRVDEAPPVKLRAMNFQRLGVVCRAVRLRKRWRQDDVAAAAGVSRAAVSRIERGLAAEMTLATLDKVTSALEIRIDLVPRWRGSEADRLVNWRHAAMHERVAELLERIGGWELAPEVSFAVYGERGVIDILAWHVATRPLLIIELKTGVVDPQEGGGGEARRATTPGGRSPGPDVRALLRARRSACPARGGPACSTCSPNRRLTAIPQPISTSKLVGTARPPASTTGEWVRAQATTSRSRSGSAPAARTRTCTDASSGPAGTSSATPTMPRSSETLPTNTVSSSRVMPSWAARMAIIDALQAADAARISHPGDGAVASPPNAAGMSVATVIPLGCVTWKRNPPWRVAVAGASFDRPDSGWARKCAATPFTASAMDAWVGIEPSSWCCAGTRTGYVYGNQAGEGSRAWRCVSSGSAAPCGRPVTMSSAKRPVISSPSTVWKRGGRSRSGQEQEPKFGSPLRLLPGLGHADAGTVFGANTTFIESLPWASSIASAARSRGIRWLTTCSNGRRLALRANIRIVGR